MVAPKVTGTLDLSWVWRQRLTFYAKGNKLCVEGDKLSVEGEKLRAEGDKLRADGDKLWAEGSKLRAEGDMLWAEAIIKKYGNIPLDWVNWNEKYQSYECQLDNGEVFGFDLESRCNAKSER